MKTETYQNNLAFIIILKYLSLLDDLVFLDNLSLLPMSLPKMRKQLRLICYQLLWIFFYRFNLFSKHRWQLDWLKWYVHPTDFESCFSCLVGSIRIKDISTQHPCDFSFLPFVLCEHDHLTRFAKEIYFLNSDWDHSQYFMFYDIIQNFCMSVSVNLLWAF